MMFGEQSSPLSNGQVVNALRRAATPDVGERAAPAPTAEGVTPALRQASKIEVSLSVFVKQHC